MFFTKKEVVLTGRNIFIDKRKRVIYYNRRNKVGYVISSGSESNYQLLNVRYVIAVIAFIFAYLLFHVNIFISIAISILTAALLEYRYRKLLDSYTQISRFDYENAEKSINAPTSYTNGALIIRIALYLALAILIIVNLFISDTLLDDIAVVVVSVVISLYSLYMCYRYVTMLMNQSKRR